MEVELGELAPSPDQTVSIVTAPGLTKQGKYSREKRKVKNRLLKTNIVYLPLFRGLQSSSEPKSRLVTRSLRPQPTSRAGLLPGDHQTKRAE
jgi:hypothetical protein